MADGIAVGLPGVVPFAIVRELVDGIETVSEESLSRALLFLLERAKLVVEPAGAAAVAHLLDSGSGAYQGPVVAVLSGGNIDPVLLLRIIRHGMAAAGRYLQFRVRVPDSPGSLARLLVRPGRGRRQRPGGRARPHRRRAAGRRGRARGAAGDQGPAALRGAARDPARQGLRPRLRLTPRRWAANRWWAVGGSCHSDRRDRRSDRHRAS